MVIFGLGYSGRVIAHRLRAEGWAVAAVGPDVPANPASASPATSDGHSRDAVRVTLRRASHVLSCVPPLDISGTSEQFDPVLVHYGDALAAAVRRGVWLGYLSSTGVYGGTGGAWVDESAPADAGRRPGRVRADAAWRDLGARVFRLPGIYGPGRSAFERIRAGAAYCIDQPGQVFSRIHVEDLAGGVLAAIYADAGPGVWNLADDAPAPQSVVMAEACRLLGVAPPRPQAVQDAPLSPQARAFYAENRRIANGRARRQLGWRLRYPSWREGLAAILASE